MKIEDINFKKNNIHSYIMMWEMWLFYKWWECHSITKEEYDYIIDVDNKRNIISMINEEQKLKKAEVYENTKTKITKDILKNNNFIEKEFEGNKIGICSINSLYNIRYRWDNEFDFVNNKLQRKLNNIVFKNFNITDDNIIISGVNILAKHPYKNRSVWQKCDKIWVSKKSLKIINKTPNYF